MHITAYTIDFWCIRLFQHLPINWGLGGVSSDHYEVIPHFESINKRIGIALTQPYSKLRPVKVTQSSNFGRLLLRTGLTYTPVNRKGPKIFVLYPVLRGAFKRWVKKTYGTIYGCVHRPFPKDSLSKLDTSMK